jgi:hypothetical protein
MISQRPPFAARTDSAKWGPRRPRSSTSAKRFMAGFAGLWPRRPGMHISRCTAASSPPGPVLFLLLGFFEWFRPLFRVGYVGPATPWLGVITSSNDQTNFTVHKGNKTLTREGDRLFLRCLLAVTAKKRRAQGLGGGNRFLIDFSTAWVHPQRGGTCCMKTCQGPPLPVG